MSDVEEIFATVENEGDNFSQELSSFFKRRKEMRDRAKKTVVDTVEESVVDTVEGSVVGTVEESVVDTVEKFSLEEGECVDAVSSSNEEETVDEVVTLSSNDQKTEYGAFIKKIITSAGLNISDVPSVEHLMRGKGGEKMAIKDIALFIKTPVEENLKKISSKFAFKNRVNLSAEVDLANVRKVGQSILRAGRMYQPIQVAKIQEDGRYECTSGRHRLAFLALLYGADTEINVYVEDMSLQEARDAVVVANMARATKALEKAQHTVIQSVGGDLEASRDTLFANTATTKVRARKYCVFSVLNNREPCGFDFDVSPNSSRKGGYLTTIPNIEKFWGNALNWTNTMSRLDYDAQLKDSVEFLNALVVEFKKNSEFDEVQHMSSMSLAAIGKYYEALTNTGGYRKPIELVGKIAKVIVSLGAIGRQKSDDTYYQLKVRMSN